MNKILFAAVFLVPVILLAGCADSTTQGYSDVGLDVEIDAPSKVLPEQVVEIEVTVTNRLESDINNAFVKVSDPFGFKQSDPSCGLLSRFIGRFVSAFTIFEDGSGGGTLPENLKGPGCFYDKIISLDDRQALFRLRAPTEEELARTQQVLRPEITVEYDAEGQTICMIPIIKQGEKTTVSGKCGSGFGQTKGPIKVDIRRELTVGVEEEEDVGREVLRNRSITSIVVTFQDVVGSDSPVTIDANNFTITLGNFNRPEKEELGRCDFKVDGKTLKLQEDVSLRDAKPLVCVLQAADITDETNTWIPGTIQADFTYRYKKVEPVPIEVITTLTR